MRCIKESNKSSHQSKNPSVVTQSCKFKYCQIVVWQMIDKIRRGFGLKWPWPILRCGEMKKPTRNRSQHDRCPDRELPQYESEAILLQQFTVSSYCQLLPEYHFVFVRVYFTCLRPFMLMSGPSWRADTDVGQTPLVALTYASSPTRDHIVFFN
jgi:hypothetical protein